MSQHQWTLEHLTWYINDTLVGEEHARVHQHLNECVSCRQEYKQLQRLSQHVGAEIDFPLNSASALAELQPQLDRSSGAGILSGLVAMLHQTPAVVRYIIAAQSTALLVLAGFMLLHEPGDTAKAEYTTLSSADSADGDLRLVFDTRLTPQEQKALLLDHGLELVGTVSNRGIATVKWSETKQLETIRSLRANSAVVLVEPVGRESE